MISSALSRHVGDQSAGLFQAADDDRCHLAARGSGGGVGRREGVLAGGMGRQRDERARRRRLKIVEI